MERSLIIKASQVKRAFTALIVLMGVLMSNTCYFGIAHRGTYQYVFYLLVLAGFFLYRDCWKYLLNVVKFIMPMMLLMIANVAFRYHNMTGSDVNQVLGIMLTILCSALMCTYVSPARFSRLYIRVIRIFCVISLPCCLLANLAPEVAMKLCQPGYNWQTRFGYSFYYTWGWNGKIFSRNSGPFWEPGAFQGFIMAALLMLLYNTDARGVRHRKFTLALFLFTILTTRSTTAYIILLVLCLTHWKRIENLVGDTSPAIRYTLIAILLVGTVAVILSSQNISRKFADADSQSASIRLADIAGGMYLTLQGGLLGLGETFTRDSMKVLAGIQQDDSAGLLSMLYTYGILFGVYYIALSAWAIKRFYNCRGLDYAVLLAFFLVLHMTEAFWPLPAFLMLAFSGMGIRRTNEEDPDVTDPDEWRTEWDVN